MSQLCAGLGSDWIFVNNLRKWKWHWCMWQSGSCQRVQ